MNQQFDHTQVGIINLKSLVSPLIAHSLILYIFASVSLIKTDVVVSLI